MTEGQILICWQSRTFPAFNGAIVPARTRLIVFRVVSDIGNARRQWVLLASRHQRFHDPIRASESRDKKEE